MTSVEKYAVVFTQLSSSLSLIMEDMPGPLIHGQMSAKLAVEASDS